MSYIDAGYVVALAVSAGYGALLWFRRRRLEVAVSQPSERDRRP